MARETVTAVCKLCGQAMAIEIDTDKYLEMTNSEREEWVAGTVIKNCKCEKAKAVRKELLHKNFKAFIHSDLVNFLDKFELEEVSIKTSEGFKAKIKKDTAGNLKVETTIKEVV